MTEVVKRKHKMVENFKVSKVQKNDIISLQYNLQIENTKLRQYNDLIVSIISHNIPTFCSYLIYDGVIIRVCPPVSFDKFTFPTAEC